MSLRGNSCKSCRAVHLSAGVPIWQAARLRSRNSATQHRHVTAAAPRDEPAPQQQQQQTRKTNTFQAVRELRDSVAWTQATVRI